MESDDILYEKKFNEMREYLPLLNDIIAKLECASGGSAESNLRGIQLSKIKSLKSLLCDNNKRMKYENLIRCEDILKKLIKVVGKSTDSETNKELGSKETLDNQLEANNKTGMNFYKELNTEQEVTEAKVPTVTNSHDSQSNLSDFEACRKKLREITKVSAITQENAVAKSLEKEIKLVTNAYIKDYDKIEMLSKVITKSLEKISKSQSFDSGSESIDKIDDLEAHRKNSRSKSKDRNSETHKKKSRSKSKDRNSETHKKKSRSKSKDRNSETHKKKSRSKSKDRNSESSRTKISPIRYIEKSGSKYSKEKFKSNSKADEDLGKKLNTKKQNDKYVSGSYQDKNNINKTDHNKYKKTKSSERESYSKSGRKDDTVRSKEKKEDSEKNKKSEKSLIKLLEYRNQIKKELESEMDSSLDVTEFKSDVDQQKEKEDGEINESDEERELVINTMYDFDIKLDMTVKKENIFKPKIDEKNKNVIKINLKNQGNQNIPVNRDKKNNVDNKVSKTSSNDSNKKELIKSNSSQNVGSIKDSVRNDKKEQRSVEVNSNKNNNLESNKVKTGKVEQIKSKSSSDANYNKKDEKPLSDVKIKKEGEQNKSKVTQETNFVKKNVTSQISKTLKDQIKSKPNYTESPSQSSKFDFKEINTDKPKGNLMNSKSENIPLLEVSETQAKCASQIHTKFELDVLHALKDELKDLSTEMFVDILEIAKEGSHNETKKSECSQQIDDKKLRRISFEKYKEKINSSSDVQTNSYLSNRGLTPKEMERFGINLNKTNTNEESVTTSKNLYESIGPDSPDSDSSYECDKTDTKEVISIKSEPLPVATKVPAAAFFLSNDTNKYLNPTSNNVTNLVNVESVNVMNTVKNQQQEQKDLKINPLHSFSTKFQNIPNRFNVDYPVSPNYKGKNPKPFFSLGYYKQESDIQNKLHKNATESIKPSSPLSDMNKLNESIDNINGIEQTDEEFNDNKFKNIIKCESSKELSLRKSVKAKQASLLYQDESSNSNSKPPLSPLQKDLNSIKSPDSPVSPYPFKSMCLSNQDPRLNKNNLIKNESEEEFHLVNSLILNGMKVGIVRQNQFHKILSDNSKNDNNFMDSTRYSTQNSFVYKYVQEYDYPNSFYKLARKERKKIRSNMRYEMNLLFQNNSNNKGVLPEGSLVNEKKVDYTTLNLPENEPKDEKSDFDKVNKKKDVVILDETETFVVYDEMETEDDKPNVENVKKDDKIEDLVSNFKTEVDEIKEPEENNLKIEIETNSEEEKPNIYTTIIFENEQEIKSENEERDFKDVLINVENTVNPSEKLQESDTILETSSDCTMDNDKNIVNSLVDVLKNKQKMMDMLLMLNKNGDDIPLKIKKKLQLLAELESDDDDSEQPDLNKDKTEGSDLNQEIVEDTKIDQEKETKKDEVKKTNTSKPKLRWRSEVELLKNALPEMYINKGGLNTDGIRKCRLKEFLQDNAEGTEKNETAKRVTRQKPNSEQSTSLDKKNKNSHNIEPEKYQFKEVTVVLKKINEVLDKVSKNKDVEHKEYVDVENDEESLDYKVKPCPKSKKKLIIQQLNEIKNSNLTMIKPCPKSKKKEVETDVLNDDQIKSVKAQGETVVKEKKKNTIKTINKSPPKKKRKTAWNKGKITKKLRKTKKALVNKEDYEKMINEYHFVEGVSRYQCKYCYEYFDEDIIKHYVENHPHTEILISRLSNKDSKEAIADSKINIVYDFFNKDLGDSYKCRFCHKLFPHNSFKEFMEHVKYFHTGEYDHYCNLCVGMCTYSEATSLEPVNTIKGFICELCNYTKIYKKNVESHIKEQHQNLKCNIYEINLLTLIPKKVMNDKSNEITEVENIIERKKSIEKWMQLKQEEDVSGIFSLSSKVSADLMDDFVDIDIANVNSMNELNIKEEILDFQNEEDVNIDISLDIKNEPFDDNYQGMNAHDIFKEQDRDLNASSGLETYVLNDCKIGKLEAKRVQDKINYICNINQCKFTADYFLMFENHIQESHVDDKWDGYCEECNKIVTNDLVSYSFAIEHMTNEHIKSYNPSNEFIKTNDTVQSTDTVQAVDTIETENHKPKINLRPMTELLSKENYENSNYFPKIQSVISLNTTQTAEADKLREYYSNKLPLNNYVCAEDSINNDKLFTCSIEHCRFTTDEMTMFMWHLLQHTKTSQCNMQMHLICIYCKYIAMNNDELCLHILNDHSHCRFKCNNCYFRSASYITVFTHSLLMHAATDNAMRVNELNSNPVVDEKILTAGILSKNVVFAPYVCNIATDVICVDNAANVLCNKKFYIFKDYYEHLTQKHKDINLDCSYCITEKMPVQNLINHILENHRDKLYSYKCAYCMNGCNTEILILHHFINYHSNRSPIYYYLHNDNVDETKVLKVNLDDNVNYSLKNIFGITLIDQSNDKNSKKEEVNLNVETEKSDDHKNEANDTKNSIIMIESDEESTPLKKMKLSKPDSDEIPNKITETPVPKEYFKCLKRYCNFQCSTLDSLNEHKVTCQPFNSLRKRLRCPHCRKSCKTIGGLKAHITRSHEELPFNPLKNVSEQNKNEPIQKPSPPKNAFGVKDISALPLMPILNNNIYCEVCSFSTKVTSNMLRHLQLHANEATVPEAAPVNPVPHLQTNEMHFDKMTNLALSSNIDKLKKPNKSRINMNEIPKMVSDKERYVCGSHNCLYISIDENMLKHHWETLHRDELQFLCVHCEKYLDLENNITKATQSIFSHLRLHEGNLYHCINCDFMHPEKWMVNRHIFAVHKIETDSAVLIRNEVAPPKEDITFLWHCGMCSFKGNKKSLTMSHCKNIHQIEFPFKCSLCTYAALTEMSIASHQSKNHQNAEGGIVRCYFKKQAKPENSSKASEAQESSNTWSGKRKRGSKCNEDKNSSKEPAKKMKIGKSNQDTDSIDNAKVKFLDMNERKIMLEMDVSVKSYSCIICKTYSTQERDEMKVHLYEEFNYKKWRCGICEYRAYDPSRITEHSINEHRIVCEINPCQNQKLDDWILKYLELQYIYIYDKSNNALDDGANEKGKVSATSNLQCPEEFSSDDDDDKLVICDEESDIGASSSQSQVSSEYLCNVCGFTGKNIALHNFKKHSRPCKCMHCEFISRNEVVMYDHYTDCHPKEKFLIHNILTDYLTTSSNKDQNITAAVDNLCPHCSEYYDLSNIGEHILNCFKEDITCKICDQDFTNTATLLTHYKNQHDKFQTNNPKKINIKSLINSYKNNQPVYPAYVCGFCPKTFLKFNGFRRHFKQKHDHETITFVPLTIANIETAYEIKTTVMCNDSFECVLSGCKMTFSDYASFEFHVKNHYRAYKCVNCTRCFRLNESYENHMKECFPSDKKIQNKFLKKGNVVIDRFKQIDTLLKMIMAGYTGTKVTNKRKSTDESPSASHKVTNSVKPVKLKQVARKSTAHVDFNAL